MEHPDCVNTCQSDKWTIKQLPIKGILGIGPFHLCKGNEDTNNVNMLLLSYPQIPSNVDGRERGRIGN